MEITKEFISSLLYEEESNVLDFKRDQYKFSNSTAFEKSELLKDILSFCNAWRRSDAYILIGVEEVKGSESKVFGVTEVLDDAQIQQFVNGKTQRPVEFSYKNLSFMNKEIALIHIPVQERPIYLLKDYGKLKKNIVYIRRGSSTAEATPDEIAEMKGTKLKISSHILPKLQLFFKNTEGDITDSFYAPSYSRLNKKEVLEKLNNLRIARENLEIVKKNREILDSIKDRYPDGNVFYPFKASIVETFDNKINNAIEMLTSDFNKLCSLIDLQRRSFGLSKSFYSKFRKENNFYPTHTLLEICNNGKCPAENIILYITGNEKVKFVSLDELHALSIVLYDQLPEHISKVIRKAQDIEKRINNPIVTMYEKVTGTKPWHSYGNLNLSRHLFNASNEERAKLIDGVIKFTSESHLMHNHSKVIPLNDIILCPFLEKDEETNLKYAFHAKNLPNPQEGKLLLKGVEYQ